MVFLNPKPDPDRLRAEGDQLQAFVREVYRKALEAHGLPIPEEIPDDVKFGMGVMAHVLGDSMRGRLQLTREPHGPLTWAIGACMIFGEAWCPPPEVIDIVEGDD